MIDIDIRKNAVKTACSELQWQAALYRAQNASTLLNNNDKHAAMLIALRAALDAADADKARAVEAERDACAGIADGEFAATHADIFRQDGVPSKHDLCPHGVVMYQDCCACVATAIRARGAKP